MRIANKEERRFYEIILYSLHCLLFHFFWTWLRMDMKNISLTLNVNEWKQFTVLWRRAFSGYKKTGDKSPVRRADTAD